jgi:tetrahydromethanopterin S-methyltransferase subunit E
VANAAPVESASAGIARSGAWARLLSLTSIGVVLVVIMALAYLIGFIIGNQNNARAVGVFAVGVVSFFGTLGLAHRSSPDSPYDSSEVRLAVTAAFMMVFFAALGIFLFSTNTVGPFGQSLMNNLTSLFGVVVGFYFASTAVVEYGRSREREKTAEAPSSSDLEAEVRSLRQLVTELAAERDRERAEGDRSAASTETDDA